MIPGRLRLVLALFALWVLAPAGLAAVRWPRYWEYLAPEQSPMTWLQSVVLVVAACASGLLAALSAYPSHSSRPSTGSASGARAWLLLCAGFTALAVDERFALHERVRDGYLAPRDVSIPVLPWVAPGDFLILLVGLAGLAVLPFVWRAARDDAWSRTALVVGVVLAATAVGLDSVDPSTWSTAAERLQQSLEEVLELASGLALLASVLLRLLSVLFGPAPPHGDSGSGAARDEGSGDRGDTLTTTGQA